MTSLFCVARHEALDAILLGIVAQPGLYGSLIIGVRRRREAVLRRDAEPLEKLPRRRLQRREIDLRLPIGISQRLQNLLALLGVDRLLLAVRPTVGPVLVDQDRGGEQ